MTIIGDIRAAVGLDKDDTIFDNDLLLYINGAFSSLSQQGLKRPDDKFEEVKTDTEWSHWWGETHAETELPGMVKEFVILHVRIVFDPPPPKTQLYMEGRLRENEWRIQTYLDGLAREVV